MEKFFYCITGISELDGPKVIAYKINDDFSSYHFLNQQSINEVIPVIGENR